MARRLIAKTTPNPVRHQAADAPANQAKPARRRHAAASAGDSVPPTTSPHAVGRSVPARRTPKPRLRPDRSPPTLDCPAIHRNPTRRLENRSAIAWATTGPQPATSALADYRQRARHWPPRHPIATVPRSHPSSATVQPASAYCCVWRSAWSAPPTPERRSPRCRGRHCVDSGPHRRSMRRCLYRKQSPWVGTYLSRVAKCVCGVGGAGRSIVTSLSKLSQHPRPLKFSRIRRPLDAMIRRTLICLLMSAFAIAANAQGTAAPPTDPLPNSAATTDADAAAPVENTFEPE